MAAVAYATILYAASGIKKVAKGIWRKDPTIINAENRVGRRPNWLSKPWGAKVDETPSNNKRSQSASISSSIYPITPLVARKKHAGGHLGPIGSIPSTSTKHYRIKRKPVPPFPADLLENPNNIVYTSIVEKAVIQTLRSLDNPPSPTASVLPSSEASTAPAHEEHGAVQSSAGPDIITRVEGEESSSSSVTRSCLNVVADEASSRLAFYWPPEHSYQALSHTMLRLANGSLDTSRITNERLIKIAIHKPPKDASAPYCVPDQRKKDSSKSKFLMTQKNGHI